MIWIVQVLEYCINIYELRSWFEHIWTFPTFSNYQHPLNLFDLHFSTRKSSRAEASKASKAGSSDAFEVGTWGHLGTSRQKLGNFRKFFLFFGSYLALDWFSPIYPIYSYIWFIQPYLLKRRFHDLFLSHDDLMLGPRRWFHEDLAVPLCFFSTKKHRSKLFIGICC